MLLLLFDSFFLSSPKNNSPSTTHNIQPQTRAERLPRSRFAIIHARKSPAQTQLLITLDAQSSRAPRSLARGLRRNGCNGYSCIHAARVSAAFPVPRRLRHPRRCLLAHLRVVKQHCACHRWPNIRSPKIE
jgi:hypothetical protein